MEATESKVVMKEELDSSHKEIISQGGNPETHDITEKLKNHKPTVDLGEFMDRVPSNKSAVHYLTCGIEIFTPVVRDEMDRDKLEAISKEFENNVMYPLLQTVDEFLRNYPEYEISCSNNSAGARDLFSYMQRQQVLQKAMETI